jgi:dipeptidyl aminopeptidase/acylaminoacyl peptidase
MFTALRVLGKPVELIEIPGEPHWILQLDKRRLWSETIIAWFDRELRDRPAYWHHLYPAEDGTNGQS